MKKLFIIAVVSLMVCLIGFVAVASACPEGDKDGKSKQGHLYLFKNDGSGIVRDAWGEMEYNLWGKTFDFVFDSHALTPKKNYTLIYYPDPPCGFEGPWLGYGLICLGSDTAKKGGNVHIKGAIETCGDLPAEYDKYYPDGAKILVVLSEDVDCSGVILGIPGMVGWNPTEYLFGFQLIRYVDTLIPETCIY